MIELVPIDSQLKLQTATEIQHRIFTCKGYDAYLNYKESVELASGGRYWLLRNTDEDAYVGVSGILTVRPDGLFQSSSRICAPKLEQQESTSSDPVCETATPYKK